MNKRRAVITGMGVLSNNGKGVKEFWEHCTMGISGIKECSLFDVSNLRTSKVGEISADIPYLVDSPSELGRIQFIIKEAIDEMFADSKLTVSDICAAGNRAFLSFATSLAANNNIVSYTHKKAQGEISGEWLAEIPCFVNWLKKCCGVGGGCYTTMSACASGTTSAGIALDLIQNNKADIVIVGGADPLTEFSCVGFHALKSLSHSYCKPFDKNRDGINIGEGGAFFLVEELEHALERNANIYAEIMGYGINNDAYHITSPSPDGCGALASMQMAMSHVEKSPLQIDYVNAHGTGTELNDRMEAKAISDLFGDNITVSSIKSLIGHCLAAAGAIELATVVLAVKNRQIPPTISLENKIDECGDANYNNKTIDKEVNFALSNSFAFAGNTASILIGAYKDE